ncbi:MAG: helix-turn-helix transcriptional regulator [Bacteroidales bacterium]|jgi:transcriptional regulator with XRE-family HTH domain|nr:helix-turn-helix transcriptional regulator [Bacteroidales bacterium]
MKQPDLGKKITELRLAKGLTQSELAQKCQLSLRTIQRIESAEVTPRSYTVKLIFQCLDYQIYDSFGKFSYRLDRLAYRIRTGPGQFYNYVKDLFNLKTHTMRKITILSLPVIATILLFLFTGAQSKAQDRDKIISGIAKQNAQITEWFNSGQIDSLGMLYLQNACMIPSNYREIQGRENIKGYYSFLYANGFRFTEITSKAIIISDSIFVDRGVWKAGQMTGTYLTQLRLCKDGKWYIENEMSNE